MSHETIEAVVVASLVIGGRVISHFEHKKTESKVNRIEISINGILQEKIEAAREEARQEERNKLKPN